MKSLIIITPKAFREKVFGDYEKINENNYKIIGMKLERMDMFFTKKWEKKVIKTTRKCLIF